MQYVRAVEETCRYLQGDFHHWVPLFNFFDAYFERHVQSRSDLQLKCEPGDAAPELPSRNLVAILKVTASILENCSNKHLYSSCEVRVDTSFRPHALLIRCERDVLFVCST